MKFEKLCEEIIQYMKSYCFLELIEDSSELRIMPLVGKIIGKYPEDFNNSFKGGIANE